MNADELLNSITIICTILAIINVWNYKGYKSLKIENELLKLKLKDCERTGTKPIHEKC